MAYLKESDTVLNVECKW